MATVFDAPKNRAAAAFTIASRPRTRRDNQTRRFLAIKTNKVIDIDGVAAVGCNGDFHVGSGYRVTIAEDRPAYWWLWGNGITAVEVVDPVDAVAVLRKRGLIEARAS
jgi:hypothetical protein